MNKKIVLLGAASCTGTYQIGTETSPALCQKEIGGTWAKIITEIPTGTKLAAKPGIIRYTTELAQAAYELIATKQFFITIGGDHACAIGTWSGVSCAVKKPLGLIWIDAHMDSHTEATTPSQNIHGMPLAALLGHGVPELTNMLCAGPKILPENLILIGQRSFESGEAELLKKLNVKIYYMEEVAQRGIAAVMQEATESLAKRCENFGVSLDIDAMDPIDVPGTGSKEPNGIRSAELLPLWHKLINHPQCIAAEIAEFNPKLDKNNITLELMRELISG